MLQRTSQAVTERFHGAGGFASVMFTGHTITQQEILYDVSKLLVIVLICILRVDFALFMYPLLFLVHVVDVGPFRYQSNGLVALLALPHLDFLWLGRLLH